MHTHIHFRERLLPKKNIHGKARWKILLILVILAVIALPSYRAYSDFRIRKELEIVYRELYNTQIDVEMATSQGLKIAINSTDDSNGKLHFPLQLTKGSGSDLENNPNNIHSNFIKSLRISHTKEQIMPLSIHDKPKYMKQLELTAILGKDSILNGAIVSVARSMGSIGPGVTGQGQWRCLIAQGQSKKDIDVEHVPKACRFLDRSSTEWLQYQAAEINQ